MTTSVSPSDRILEKLSQMRSAGANEAETRLKIIDEVLRLVLGWTLDDLSVEKRVSEDGVNEYADYIVRTGSTTFVVEAKKVGADFSDLPNERRCLLRGKIMQGEIGDAIKQARDYARRMSIPFAIVTNGNAWIVFSATRTDEVTFAQSSCIIFPTLEVALRSDFTDFVNLLSRNAVVSGSLENELLGRIENQTEERRLNRFYLQGGGASRKQSVFPLIEDAVNLAFSEDIILQDKGMLEKCYIRTPDRMKFDERINMYIRRHQVPLPVKPIRPLKEGRLEHLSAVVSGAGRQIKPVAILVLGPVGAGKTTFLEYSRQIAAKAALEPVGDRPYPHWIQVDYRTFSPSDNSFDFLINALFEHISRDPFLGDSDRCGLHAYKDEIEALFRGPLKPYANDKERRTAEASNLMLADFKAKRPYVEKILDYVSKNSPIFLIIDNIDQLELAKLQNTIFGDAIALAQRFRLNLICSLREETYAVHKSSSVFDAFDFETISIDPPPAEAVLARRFFVMRALLDGKSGSFVAENGSSVSVANLADISNLLQDSIIGNELGRQIDVLAGSDIRLALRMTRTFLQYGYTSASKALRLYQSRGKYVMPQHEALRSIILSGRTVYDERYSNLGNPFDAHMQFTQAQLLRLFILSALVQYSSTKSFQSVAGEEIQISLKSLGFSEKLTLGALADLCRLRYASTAAHGAAAFVASFNPTRLGGYFIRSYLANFVFLENFLMDTFIADKDTWDAMRRLTEEISRARNLFERLNLRKNRVQLFYNYMESSFNPLAEQSRKRRLPVEWCSNPFEERRSQFDLNLKRILASASRLYGDTKEGG